MGARHSSPLLSMKSSLVTASVDRTLQGHCRNNVCPRAILLRLNRLCTLMYIRIGLKASARCFAIGMAFNKHDLVSCGFLSLHSAKQVCAFLITHRASLLVHPWCGSDRAPACYIPHAAWCFSRIRRGRCNPRRHQHYPVAFTEPSHHCARWLQHPVRTYGAYSLLRLLRHQQVLYFNATAFAWPLPQRCGTSGFSTAMIQHLQLLQLRLCVSNTRFLRFSNNIGSSCITITSLQLRFFCYGSSHRSTFMVQSRTILIVY